MPTFTYQLLAVLALSAPGLALLIGFFYSERPVSSQTSVIISTTPPPPTAFVSLGVVLLAALAIHVLTLCSFMLLDAVGSFVGPPLEGLRPYRRLIEVARKGDPSEADLILSSIILLLQIGAGLAAGRSVPALVISGLLPLASVYGWLTPYVAAARDEDKLVFASVVLKANAKDGLLLGYDGVVTSIRLDADFAVKTIVLDPANRFALSLSSRSSDPERSGDAEPSDIIGKEVTIRSNAETMREPVPPVTLSGAEIFSTNFTISDIADYANEVDDVPSVSQGAAPPWWLRTALGVLLLLAPAAVLRWTMPISHSTFLPKWAAGLVVLAAGIFAVASMTTRSADGGRIGGVDHWVALASAVSAFLPILALGTTAAWIALTIVCAMVVLTSCVIALSRLSRAEGAPKQSSRLLQSLAALAFAAALQAVASRTPLSSLDVHRIGFAGFAIVAVLVAFALTMRTLTGGTLLCALSGLVAIGIACQASASAAQPMTLSLLLLGAVCLIEAAAFGRGSLKGAPIASPSRDLAP